MIISLRISKASLRKISSFFLFFSKDITYFKVINFGLSSHESNRTTRHKQLTVSVPYKLLRNQVYVTYWPILVIISHIYES